MGDAYTFDHPSYAKLGPRRLFFPRVLYKIVNDPSTDSVISWSENGKSFIVWEQEEFCRDLLPRVVRLLTLPVFVTRLKEFEFKKVESEHWEYANEDFVRGKPDLTFEIQKRYKESLGPRILKFKADPAVLERRRAYIKDMMRQRRALANLTL